MSGWEAATCAHGAGRKCGNEEAATCAQSREEALTGLKREEVQREEKTAKETRRGGKLSQSWGVSVGLGEAAAMGKWGVVHFDLGWKYTGIRGSRSGGQCVRNNHTHTMSITCFLETSFSRADTLEEHASTMSIIQSPSGCMTDIANP